MAVPNSNEDYWYGNVRQNSVTGDWNSQQQKEAYEGFALGKLRADYENQFKQAEVAHQVRSDTLARDSETHREDFQNQELKNKSLSSIAGLAVTGTGVLLNKNSRDTLSDIGSTVSKWTGNKFGKVTPDVTTQPNANYPGGIAPGDAGSSDTFARAVPGFTPNTNDRPGVDIPNTSIQPNNSPIGSTNAPQVTSGTGTNLPNEAMDEQSQSFYSSVITPIFGEGGFFSKFFSNFNLSSFGDMGI
jgi:hypothetical protein